MNLIKSSTVVLLLTTINTYGQSRPEMADSLRSSGGIYVVVIILLIILCGLLAYLIFTDRKLKKLEDDIKNKEL